MRGKADEDNEEKTRYLPGQASVNDGGVHRTVFIIDFECFVHFIRNLRVVNFCDQVFAHSLLCVRLSTAQRSLRDMGGGGRQENETYEKGTETRHTSSCISSAVSFLTVACEDAAGSAALLPVEAGTREGAGAGAFDTDEREGRRGALRQ